MFAANPGSAQAPSGESPSGGELSRVRLALEVVLGWVNQPGALLSLTRWMPVSVVPSAWKSGADSNGSPQEASGSWSRILRSSAADQHFVIAKSSDGQVTTSDVTLLDESRNALRNWRA